MKEMESNLLKLTRKGSDEIKHVHMNTLDLLEHGEHCTFGLCRQFTFMPVNCDCCHKIFCEKHWRAENHRCPDYVTPNMIPTCPKCSKALRKPKEKTYRQMLEEHQDSGCKKYLRNKKRICKKRGCKKKAQVVCTSCSQRLCLGHRWADEHNCVETKEMGSVRIMKPTRVVLVR